MTLPQDLNLSAPACVAAHSIASKAPAIMRNRAKAPRIHSANHLANHHANRRRVIFFVFLMALWASVVLPAPKAQAADESGSHAAGEQIVNIYSYRQPFLIDPILKSFEQETGIKTNVIFAKVGLIERLASEGAHSPADLILTSDFANLMKAKDYAQAVSSPTLTQAIPANARDPQSYWFGLTWRARVAYVSKDRVPQSEIRYEDLADPVWKGRICMRDGQHPYNIALFAALIAHHGEAWTKTWLAGLRDNLAMKPSGNDRAQVRNIYAGQCDLALGNTYYMGKMQTNEDAPEQQEWANSVKLIFPNSDDRGVHANVSGVILTKYAPHRQAAIQLMEYLVSDMAQKHYASENFEYPIRPDVALDPRVASWGAFKPDALSLATIDRHTQRASQLVDEVAFNQGPQN